MGELTIHLLCNMKKMLILFIGCVVLEQRAGAEQTGGVSRRYIPHPRSGVGAMTGYPTSKVSKTPVRQ